MAVGQPRLRDVADRAGVSAKTVSNVVTGSVGVSPQTRKRVQRAIDELGYHPNALARGLKTGRTRIIALVLPDIRVPFSSALAHAVLEVAQERGTRVVIEETAHGREDEKAVLPAGGDGIVEGILLQASPSVTAPCHPERNGIPTVVIAATQDGIEEVTLRLPQAVAGGAVLAEAARLVGVAVDMEVDVDDLLLGNSRSRTPALPERGRQASENSAVIMFRESQSSGCAIPDSMATPMKLRRLVRWALETLEQASVGIQPSPAASVQQTPGGTPKAPATNP
ncbi:LacI family DNA-binding transcriptional regulator [Curtobacterium sp. MCBD17_013]|uniref:LacI family DNA-binding transcriptional regulator n=1 Tax=Curtobacterium sp. MCBD17_013 TaxID=2175668 RepID=UPI0015E8B4EC|nr:LacI family DNA-binding transcriptional regulator [Curtobacterium sp. MCBD17_013]